MIIRTLIVEDDPAVAEVNRGYLDRIPGFAVAGTAGTGNAALAALERSEIDLMLLDFNLPDISGLDVCRALKARPGPPVDIIAVTAKRDLETVRTAVAQGVIQYLIKPYSFAMFSDKLSGYAGYRSRLYQTGLTDQQGVDRTLAELRPTPSMTVPKGLSEATYERVVALVRGSGESYSASDVAEHTGLARVSARRYLEHLHGQGLVRLLPQYGTPGRPEHRFQWVNESR
jgi:response regulator of citrate/malate metabolism